MLLAQTGADCNARSEGAHNPWVGPAVRAALFCVSVAVPVKAAETGHFVSARVVCGRGNGLRTQVVH